MKTKDFKPKPGAWYPVETMELWSKKPYTQFGPISVFNDKGPMVLSGTNYLNVCAHCGECLTQKEVNNMGEEQTYSLNDTHRAIERIMEDLKRWESPQCDARVKSIILTKLEEAQLWSLKLVKKLES